MLDILQVFMLTLFTVSFPFRMWIIMLDAEEAMEEARRVRQEQQAFRLSEIRAELGTQLGIGAALGYGGGEPGALPDFQPGLQQGLA
jgi:hypothetical protein